MKIHFLPQTRLGKWASVFALLWPLFTILGTVTVNTFYPNIEAGNGIIDDLRVRPILAAIMLIGISSGAASFPANLLAIIKKGERSILSLLATFLGLFLVILLLGELFVEH